ncbi:zona pellucida sperm-binding protein 3 [Columba guinea]|nr:zona pellucida sperm-binding protein 3 [Columba guinea]
MLCRTGSVSSVGVQPTWVPFGSTAAHRRRLRFALDAYDSTWSSRRHQATYSLGDIINIEASVSPDPPVSLRVFVDECVASPSVVTQLKFKVIGDNGCLLDGQLGRSHFLPRRGDGSLRFQLDTFLFLNASGSQGMGNLRLGSRAVMYTAETLPKGKNRVMGTIQIMTGFMHIGFGIILTTLTKVYTSVFVIGEIPFLGGVSFIISGCLSIGAEKSPTECAVKGSQTMNVISAIFALLGIVAFIVDLNLNGLYRSGLDYYSYLVLLAGNGISIVLLIFTILEFCIAVATANFWCRATRLSSNEAMLIVPSATQGDLAVPLTELPQPPSYTEVIYDPKEQPS